MHIGSFDTHGKVLVVAEIGNNHEGRLDVARDLIRRAGDCGADAVKLQTFRTEHYVSRADAERFARLKSFELGEAAFEELAALARSLGLLFLSTPFDLSSAAFLEPIVDAFKIASGDNTFYPLLERVARVPKPMIVSTGLADFDQVRRTVDFVLRHRGPETLAVLHCVTAYPVPPEQAGLRALPFLRSRLPVTVGYSDHTLGIEACLAATALGARILEKHFTLDHHFSDFRDHRISANPDQLAELVRRVRQIEPMLGVEEKVVQPVEQAALLPVRRSVVAGRDLRAGHRLEAGDLTWIRPGGGLPPGEEGTILGRRLRKNVRFGERLGPADVE